MQTSDRADFSKALDRLCQVFDKRITDELFESYWTALQKMKLPGWIRTVDHAIETCERMPKPKQLWSLYHELKVRAVQQRAGAEKRQQAGIEHKVDEWTAGGNLALVTWLMRNGPLSEAQLERVVAEKDRIAEQHRFLASEERVPPAEFLSVLHRAWDRVLLAARAAA